MIAFLIIAANVTGLIVGAFLGVVFADEIRERAARLTSGQGSHTAIALAEEVTPATSPAGVTRTELLTDAEPEQAPEPEPEPLPADAWRPSIDVFASYAAAADEAGLPPMRLYAAGRRDVTRVDRGTPPAGVLTGPLPAVTDEATRDMYLSAPEPRGRHEITQPLIAAPAAGHPCCRHCTDGTCTVPHAVACFECHAPDLDQVQQWPAVTYGEAPVAEVLRLEAMLP